MTDTNTTEVTQEVVDAEFHQPEAELLDKVISVDRISRTVKGGRRIRFRVLVVVGNRAGRIGIGVAKANDVQTAIAKAKNKAKKSFIQVPIDQRNDSIPHEVTQQYASTKIILKPAPTGHSLIAGGAVRSVVELAGIKNIVSKSLGSSNAINNATATYLALQQLKAVKSGKK